MFEVNGMRQIQIQTENGVYRFNNISGIGKTYLSSVMRALQITGSPVVAFTYEDYQRGEKLRELVDKVKPEVIILDRADQYLDDKDILNVIHENMDKATILIDKKQGKIKDTPWKPAGIRFDIDCIVVTG